MSSPSIPSLAGDHHFLPVPHQEGGHARNGDARGTGRHFGQGAGPRSAFQRRRHFAEPNLHIGRARIVTGPGRQIGHGQGGPHAPAAEKEIVSHCLHSLLPVMRRTKRPLAMARIRPSR